MTDKERIHAALEGKPADEVSPIDRMPVTVLYNHLYQLDHFAELTGRKQWEWRKWLASEPEEHLALYRQIIQSAPFEILQPQSAAPRDYRRNAEFIEKDGEVFEFDKSAGDLKPLKLPPAGKHASDYAANETQRIFTKNDVRKIKTVKAEKISSSGTLDYARAVVQEFGRDRFILTGGLTGILWACVSCLGQTNMLRMLIEEPDLVEYLSRKLLEQEIERIRAFCSAGGDAIFIDDAMAYSDVISVKHYERFSLPYLGEMVKEIHRLGHKAILIYFGGVMDRLEQIASTGADGLSVETSMKNYTNNMAEITGRIGRRISLFGNIDPIGILEKGTDEELAEEIERQAEAGRKARGFIMCTGSPITPATPLDRVRKFLALAQNVKRSGNV